MKNVFKINSDADVNQVRIFGDLAKELGYSVAKEVFTVTTGKFISIGTSSKYDIRRGSKLSYYLDKGYEPIDWDLAEAVKSLNLCSFDDDNCNDCNESEGITVPFIDTTEPLVSGSITIRNEEGYVRISNKDSKKALTIPDMSLYDVGMFLLNADK
jgi:hypothetical protein